jgi:ATP-dependent RNA helicase DDX35
LSYQSFLLQFNIPLRSDALDTLEAIQKSVVHGFFANAAQLQPDATYRSIRGGQALHVHPNSSLFKGALPQYVVFG